MYLSVKVAYPWVQKFHSHDLHKDVYCIVYKLQKSGSSVSEELLTRIPVISMLLSLAISSQNLLNIIH